MGHTNMKTLLFAVPNWHDESTHLWYRVSWSPWQFSDFAVLMGNAAAMPVADSVPHGTSDVINRSSSPQSQRLECPMAKSLSAPKKTTQEAPLSDQFSFQNTRVLLPKLSTIFCLLLCSVPLGMGAGMTQSHANDHREAVSSVVIITSDSHLHFTSTRDGRLSSSDCKCVGQNILRSFHLIFALRHDNIILEAFKILLKQDFSRCTQREADVHPKFDKIELATKISSSCAASRLCVFLSILKCRRKLDSCTTMESRSNCLRNLEEGSHLDVKTRDNG